MPISTLFNVLPQHKTLRTIVLMRLIALAGQLLVLAIAQFWLGIDLPLPPLITAILFLAVFNGWTWRRMQRAHPAGNAELFIQLLADIATLSALLYFSGGATNPFVSFYLPALAVAAAILPWRYAAVLALCSVAAYSLLTSVYVPLQIEDEDRAVTYHLAGMWANFAVSAGLITWFVAYMSTALRERDTRLAQARERQLRNERIVALGTQAAGAAHEMGTPLSTVAVIAGELLHETAHDPALAAYRDDLATIEAQIALCKTALERMGMSAEDSLATPAAPVRLTDWLEPFVERWRLRHPATRMSLALAPCDARVANIQAVGQILHTLLDNAARAAAESETPIGLALAIGPQTACMEVTDDGPGIAPGLLKRLGYEPVESAAGGQGIGLLLAFATARQIGATLDILPLRPHGTVAKLTVALA